MDPKYNLDEFQIRSRKQAAYLRDNYHLFFKHENNYWCLGIGICVVVVYDSNPHTFINDHGIQERIDDPALFFYAHRKEVNQALANKREPIADRISNVRPATAILTVKREPESFGGRKYIEATMHFTEVADLTIVQLALRDRLEQSRKYAKMDVEEGEDASLWNDDVARIESMLKQIIKL